MLQKGFLKPRLSIDVIGKFNFWQGIFFGIAASILLNLFLNFSREVFRFFSRLNELVVYSEAEYLYADFFCAFLSAFFGFGVCLHIWLGRGVRGLGKRYRHDFAKTVIHLFLILPLLAISRMGTVILLPLVNLPGYENHLNFHLEFPILFLLLPCVLFLVFWQGIRLNFRVGFWIPKTLFVVLCSGLLLFTFLRLDRGVVDRTDLIANSHRYSTIKAELELARKRGIPLSESTILVLGKFSTASKMEMNQAVIKAFQNGHPVSSDTLVLQKVMLKNLDHRFLARPFENGIFTRENYWSYAKPKEVYHQIALHDPGAMETLILFEILSEIVGIASAGLSSEPTDATDIEEPGEWMLEFEKQVLANQAQSVIEQLDGVVERLLKDTRYESYRPLISKIGQ